MSTMSSRNKWEGIKFTWKIENFLSYIEYFGSVTSPSFGLSSLEWKVFISYKDSYISVKVENIINTINYLNFSSAVIGCDGLPLIWQQATDISKRDIDFNHYIEMDNSIFLPNGTLTIQCCIWRTTQGLTSPVSRFARTRIEPTPAVMKKTFTWDVCGISSLQLSQYFERVETIIYGEYLTIKLVLGNNDIIRLELDTSFDQVDMNIKVDLLHTLGEENDIANANIQFNKRGESYHINTNVAKNMLLSFSNHYLPSDTLSLQFICTFTRNVHFNRMVGESEFMNDFSRTPAVVKDISESSVSARDPENQPSKDLPNGITHPPKPLNTAIQSLQEALNEGLLSDFNLRVGDRVFAVHKVILAMRSQVFRAMFTSEMKDNFIDIPDVDEYSIQRLLQFVYSDKFDEDMGRESALNLYAAADKFSLEPLKQRCSQILQSGLCVSNVLEVLSLADMRLDQDLKSATLEFISLNDQDIVDTEMWNKFEEENAKLALNTLRNLYKKKMNA